MPEAMKGTLAGPPPAEGWRGAAEECAWGAVGWGLGGVFSGGDGLARPPGTGLESQSDQRRARTCLSNISGIAILAQ